MWGNGGSSMDESRYTFLWDTRDDACLFLSAKQGKTKQQIADELKRSLDGVVWRARMLGVKFKLSSMFWSPEHAEHLRRLAQAGYNSAAIALKIGRSKKATQIRARQLGIKIMLGGWLPEDDADLAQYAAERMTLTAAARALGRSYNGVKCRARKLGIKFQSARRLWTPAEDAELRRMAAAGARREDVAKKLDRPIHGTNRRAELLRIRFSAKRSYASDTIWHAPERLAEIKTWWLDGVSGGDIAKRIGTTRSAVIAKMHRLGCARSAETRAKARNLLTRKQARRNAKQKLKADKTPPKPGKLTIELVGLQRTAFKAPNLPIAPADDVARVSHQDLESEHCRWPVGDPNLLVHKHLPLYCGERRAEGLPYCSAHCLRAFKIISFAPNHQYAPDG